MKLPPVERREVRPVQVFEHKDQCAVSCDGIEGFTDFADHALARGTERVAVQPLIRLHERSEL
jgi:hypothetical protein